MARFSFFCAVIATQLAATVAFVHSPALLLRRELPGFGRVATQRPCSSTSTTRIPISGQPQQTSVLGMKRQQKSAARPPSATQECIGDHIIDHRERGEAENRGLLHSAVCSSGPSLELSESNLSTNLSSDNSRPSLPPSATTTAGYFAARMAVTASAALAAGLSVAVFAPAPAAAAAAKVAEVAAASSEHLHVGQKIANFFRRGGLPDWATLMAISAMPVVELRGGVPVGLWMGMPIAKTFGLCVAGNMIPIPIILLALRSEFVQRLAKPVLDRAREKAAGFGDEKSQALALTLFVGIPLPGTGGWTGAMGAFLLGMPFGKVIVFLSTCIE